MKLIGVQALLALWFLTSAYGKPHNDLYIKDLDPNVLKKVNPKFLESWNENNPLPHAWPCPLENDIKPCVCTTNEKDSINLDCSAIQKDTDLETIFDVTFPFPAIREFKIVHDQTQTDDITSLTAEMFNDKTFEIITIQGTNLTYIKEEAFSLSHESLKFLNLDKNNLYDFPFETLILYISLDTLSLNHNHFADLPQINSESLKQLSMNFNSRLNFNRDAFNKVPNLEVLSLESIELERLLPNIFKDHTSLKVIKLSSNKLTTLEENAINPEQSLLELRLGYNNIVDIYHDSISGLDPKGIVDVSHNKIIEITESTWGSVFQQLEESQSMNFQGNENLICGCDIYWIKKNETIDSKVTEATQCFDNTNFHNLDVSFFDKHCQ